MEGMNKSRGLIGALMAAIGSSGGMSPIADIKVSGGAPRWHRTGPRVKHGKYIPGNAYPNGNCRGSYVRNPKVAAQMNEMHNKIHGAGA